MKNGEMLQKNIKIDYFCDRQASNILSMEGIPVVTAKQLEDLVKIDGRRATIVICVGLNKVTVTSIYKDLTKLEINADVFDYFENSHIFNDKFFDYNGKNYSLYEHPFNCGYSNTRMTERSLEVALAMSYLETVSDKVVEVGAVTPYYFTDDKIVDIIDPTDEHYRVNIKKSLFECDLRGKNVIDAIEKITYEADSCFITVPLGYNEMFDNWIKCNKDNLRVRIMERGINNHWEEIRLQDYRDIAYTPLWACGLVIIQNDFQ